MNFFRNIILVIFTLSVTFSFFFMSTDSVEAAFSVGSSTGSPSANYVGTVNKWLKDPEAIVRYELDIYDVDKRRYLNNGDTVEPGSILRFSLSSNLNTDTPSISANGDSMNGGSLANNLNDDFYYQYTSKIYNYFVSDPDNSPLNFVDNRNDLCPVSYTGKYTAFHTLYYYLHLLVQEPNFTLSHSGVDLDCNADNTECTVNSTGTLRTSVSIEETFGKFWFVLENSENDPSYRCENPKLQSFTFTFPAPTNEPTISINVAGNSTLDLKAKGPDDTIYSNGPITVDSGDTVTLNWTGSNVSGCRFDLGISRNVLNPPSSTTDNPTSNKIYRLVCNKDSGGTIDDSVTVNVTEPTPAPTINLQTNKTTVWPSDDPATLTWTSTDATACTNNFNTSTATENNTGFSVQPATQTTYSITCTGAGGSDTDSVTINVESLPTADLEPENSTITSEDSQILTWNSTNSDVCSINQGIGNVTPVSSGTVSVSPPSNTNYILTCSKTINENSTRSAGDSVNVTVNQAASCGTASWEDGWNLYDSLSSIPSSQLCSVGSGQALQEYTDPKNGKRNFAWECNNFGDVKECFALKTPTLLIQPDTQTIDNGEIAPLKLKTENIKPGSCVSTQPDFNPSVSTPTLTSADYEVSPSVNTTYGLTCTTAYDDRPDLPQTYSAEANVYVNNLPTDLTLTTNKTEIWSDDDFATLSWTGTNIAGNCYINRVGPVGNPGSSVNVSPDVSLATPNSIYTTTYTVTCDSAASAGGERVSSNSVQIKTYPLPTISLTASPTSVWEGNKSTLTWDPNYSDLLNTCTGTGFDPTLGSVSTDDGINFYATLDVTPPLSGTNNYQISCSKTLNSGVSRLSTASTQIEAQSIPTFEVDLQIRESGAGSYETDDIVDLTYGAGDVDLRWDESEASNCTLTPAVSGYIPGETNQTINGVLHESDITYTLECTRVKSGITQRASDEATVNVSDGEDPTNNGGGDFSVFCASPAQTEISGGSSLPLNDDYCDSDGQLNSLDVVQTEIRDNKFTWICQGILDGKTKNSGLCTAECETGYVPDPGGSMDFYSRKCVADSGVNILKWEVDPNIVNKGEKCFAEWEIVDPEKLGIDCEIQGSNGFLKEGVGLTGNSYGLDPGQEYRLYCSYTSATGSTISDTEDWERCVLNPDVEEF